MAKGTAADRLIRAWLDDADDAFEELAEALISGGRDGVLAAAVRKLSGRYQDDAVDDFADDLTSLAEAAADQPGFHFADLALLPIVAAGGALPDAAILADGLARSGALPAEAEFVCAPGWRTAAAIQALPPGALRRVLLDVADGRPPAGLPPAPAGEAEGDEVMVLVGATVFRRRPAEDDPASDTSALTAAEEALERRSLDAFARWRSAVPPDVLRGARILPICGPSDLAYEVEAFLDAAAPGVEEALDEVRDFVETARAEAGGEAVETRLAVLGSDVELVVRTLAGFELDRRTFSMERTGLTVDDFVRASEGTAPAFNEPG